MSKNTLRRATVDVVRVGLRYVLRWHARRVIGDVDLLYERQATFQDIGRAFQRRGSWWIVESNGPFWYEAGTERKSLAFVSYARRLEVRAYRDADLVVAVSDALKEIIVRESGRDADGVYVLPNATDTDRFDPARATARRIAPSPVIGWVGYMTEWAGLSQLIGAVASLRQAGRELHVVLVGDGPERAHLEAEAACEHIADVVHFVGHVQWDEVPNLMAGFDLAFSGQQPMSVGAMYHSPQKLYEYQSMALPIVATDFPDARNLLRDTDAGWIFQADDAGDLRRALEQALYDGDYGRRGERARENIIRNHTWEARVRTLLAELDGRGMLGTRCGNVTDD